MINLKLRHNRAKSIAGSPCGDPGLESCKNPTAIRLLSTPWARIRRRSGKFNLQLKFAGWSADSWGNFTIRRRPPGRRRDAAEHRAVTCGPPSDFSWENIAKNRPISAGPPWDYPPMIARRSDGDPGMICRQPRQGKSPNGDCTVTARPPAGVRRETAGHVNIISCDFHLEKLLGCNENNNGL